MVEGGFTTAMGCLFSGLFLTGFALKLGASRTQIGILFALPALCGVAQLLGSYWIERRGQTKRLCLWTSALSRILYLPVLAAPLLLPGISAETRVWLIVGLMALSQIFASLGGVAWLSWTKMLVPANVRLPFLGRRNLVTTALSFATCMVGAVILDRLSGNDHPYLGFLIVFAGAVICGFIGWLLLCTIPAADSVVWREESSGVKLLSPLRQPNLRRIVLFYAVWNLAADLAAPFIPVFYLQKLHLSYGFIMVICTLNSAAGLATNNFWTRMAHRFGLKPIVFLATLGDACLPLLLLFIDADHCWMLVPIQLLGVFNTPIALGPDNFMLKLTPDRNASSYMAIFRAIVGPVAAISAVLGGWLAGSWGSASTLGEPLELNGLKLVFLVSFVGRVASLPFLSGVAEPGARPLGYVALVLQRLWTWGRLRRAATVKTPAHALPLRDRPGSAVGLRSAAAQPPERVLLLPLPE